MSLSRAGWCGWSAVCAFSAGAWPFAGFSAFGCFAAAAAGFAALASFLSEVFLSGAFLSAIDLLSVRLEEAQLAAVLHHAETDAIGLPGDGIPDGDVRDVDRHFLRDDSARLVLHRVGLRVPLHLVDAVDDDVRVVDIARDVAALALVAPCDDDDAVALPDLAHGGLFEVRWRQRTSGASETIFMNRSVRSSRVTGPKMRVPIGSSLLLSSTAAFVSKRMSAPSSRRTPWRVRTTTAL